MKFWPNNHLFLTDANQDFGRQSHFRHPLEVRLLRQFPLLRFSVSRTRLSLQRQRRFHRRRRFKVVELVEVAVVVAVAAAAAAAASVVVGGGTDLVAFCRVKVNNMKRNS